MAKIFVSYRREDNPDAAGRIYDRLKEHFGGESVFFDIDAVPFGTDFRIHVDDVVSKCDILLVVIGDRWLEVDDQGKSRLENPADFVRIEVEAALNRDIPVIPIPVGNAQVPKPSQLPDVIKDLSYRNAAEVRSGTAFRGHIERLIQGVESYFAASESQQQEQARLLAEEAEAKRKAEEKVEAGHKKEEAELKDEIEQPRKEEAVAAKQATERKLATKATRKKRAIWASGTGLVLASIVVFVVFAPPVIQTFSSDRTSITEGDKVTFTWRATRADKVILAPPGKIYSRNGSLTVSPSKDTGYRLTAYGRGGATSKYIKIEVEYGKLPRVESRPKGQISPADPWRVVCHKGPDKLERSTTCPVIRYQGLTYWALSHNDNRYSMMLVGYDDDGKPVKQFEREGARYVHRIDVDQENRVVVIWGQASRRIVASWGDLEAP